MKSLALLVPVFLSGLLFSSQSLGQDKGTPITFHVTAIRSDEAHDYCTTGECSATRFTVEGYSDATEYVLTCIEILAQKPSPHYTITCGRLHAHNDYDARLFADVIAFGEYKPRTSDEPIEAAYRIISEKESSKPKR